ncbi:MAG: peptidylprolyl isomerase [Thermodesulfobacteriota bacterium]|nr:peptidylprolyl isomerase [Thermodesulfobacteriota bacterium]
MKSWRNVALAFLLLLLVLACSNTDEPGLEGQPVIQVDDLVLTLAEFNEFFEPFRMNQAQGQEDGQALREARLRFLLQLVEEMIMLRRAEELEVHVSAEELEEAVSGIEGGYGGAGFKDMFMKQAISLETWKKRLKAQLIVKKVVHKELAENITVTPEEIGAFHNRHREKWAAGTGEQIRAYHILLSTEEDADRILGRLKKGEDFATLARLFSEAPEAERGGDMGFVARGELPKCLEDPLFALEKDRLSQVVQTLYGNHIFKVVEKRAASKPIMDEWIEKAKKNIRDQKIEAAYGPWLARLRSRYRITVNKEII